MLSWPEELPDPDPNYTLKAVSVTDRYGGDQGFMRARPLAKANPYSGNVTWLMTDDQYQVFRHFRTFGLRKGADSFRWPCYIDGDFHIEEARFAGEPDEKYFGYKMWQVSAVMHLPDVRGSSVGYDLQVSDRGVDRTIEVISGSFQVSRVDVYVRTGFDGGSATLKVGFADDNDALVTATPITAQGAHTVVRAGTDYAGTSMGATASNKTLVCRIDSAGTMTEGDVSVIVRRALL